MENNEELLKIQNETNSKLLKIEELRNSTRVPSKESIEKILAYISENVPEDMIKTPLIKMLIKESHHMASVIDVPSSEIDELFKKYNIVAPVFEKE